MALQGQSLAFGTYMSVAVLSRLFDLFITKTGHICGLSREDWEITLWIQDCFVDRAQSSRMSCAMLLSRGLEIGPSALLFLLLVEGS